ncbi:MAG: PH domain-containing protein [Pseudomonadota bacterium]|nr:PH domain-containing protein [Pseudomonadota bacterium]
MSATVPTATGPDGSIPAAARVAAPLVSRAQGVGAPRPKTASPWPWSPPGAVRLAPDERLVWQGGPSFTSMAVRLYHIRFVAGYGALLTLADVVQAKMQGLTLWPALEAAIPGVLTTLAGMAIFAALAWCSARTTRYTVTSHRVVMQCGLAMPKTIGIPFPQIAAVAVRVRGDGTGDITLLPRPGSKLVYLKLWPFARPWHLRRPEPMMRDVPSAGYVASVLSRNVANATDRASIHRTDV